MSGKKRTASSSRWMQEHFDDHYVKLAQKRGLRSRAAFKIEEIQDKDKLIRPGMTATVDIKAMDRSVLSYLTKPITKTLSQGLGER